MSSSPPATKEEAMMEREEEDSEDAAAAEDEEDGGVERYGFVCCICLEPWTCYDAHRICCIPCGHVYGRSCLERWFLERHESRAKCPECGEPFAPNKIINLYASGNLWDGCCRIQEVKAHIAEVESNMHKLVKRQAKLESKVRALEDRREVKFMAQRASRSAKMRARSGEDGKLMDNANSVTEELIQVPQNAVAVVKTEFLSMKEQMERLAEQNATPMELIKFMEQNSAKLWDRIIPRHLPRTDG
ncbi:hypothetical protein QOZ80_3AG0249760 [Eleusine coracana subsp. coracana]|uniref:RING-type domain-containing protein n=1 Tax=Eleusine coracana subsp. coracana TaxID=191504 RepID=A0AAV9FUA9_ELECO|nr:hypothetical protein QOZ80_UnG0726570 [Eleusine coracana subsp. coracana]KAK3151730.1 hypothetical protein QOZ80_3AG0249760 [Eleusine coracana subsp. coracana]